MYLSSLGCFLTKLFHFTLCCLLTFYSFPNTSPFSTLSFLFLSFELTPICFSFVFQIRKTHCGTWVVQYLSTAKQVLRCICSSISFGCYMALQTHHGLNWGRSGKISNFIILSSPISPQVQQSAFFLKLIFLHGGFIFSASILLLLCSQASFLFSLIG